MDWYNQLFDEKKYDSSFYLECREAILFGNVGGQYYMDALPHYPVMSLSSPLFEIWHKKLQIFLHVLRSMNTVIACDCSTYIRNT